MRKLPTKDNKRVLLTLNQHDFESLVIHLERERKEDPYLTIPGLIRIIIEKYLDEEKVIT